MRFINLHLLAFCISSVFAVCSKYDWSCGNLLHGFHLKDQAFSIMFYELIMIESLTCPLDYSTQEELHTRQSNSTRAKRKQQQAERIRLKEERKRAFIKYELLNNVEFSDEVGKSSLTKKAEVDKELSSPLAERKLLEGSKIKSSSYFNACKTKADFKAHKERRSNSLYSQSEKNEIKSLSCQKNQTLANQKENFPQNPNIKLSFRRLGKRLKKFILPKRNDKVASCCKSFTPLKTWTKS
jgi:hypothetical protein